MADERVNECSSKIDSISLLNLSEAENLFEERKCTNRNNILPSNCKLKLHWPGDFTSLRHFVCNVIKLHGGWSQPGGDKKVFSGDSFSIIWRKSKRTLNIDGKDSDKVKRLFCNELCGVQNSTQVGHSDGPVNQCSGACPCKCSGLSADMARVQLETVIMQRDIKVNSSGLSDLSDIVSVLRDEVRDIRQRLGKQDENVNLNLFSQTGSFEALSQSCLNHVQMNCIDNSTQTIDKKTTESQLCSHQIQKNCADNSTQTIETKLIEPQLRSNYTQTSCNNNSMQSLETKTAEFRCARLDQHTIHSLNSKGDLTNGLNDQNSNNSVIITRNTNSLASETRDDDGMMEIHHLHEELVSENTSTYCINRKHDLIQRQFNTLSAATENGIPISTTSYNTEGFVNPNDLDQESKQANNRQEQ